MSESATTTRVERRMRKTASSLTSVSRRLTAERGLAGFTIEEVCDEVDVSRRTFFNYFACKEDAVIGENSDNEFELLADAFLAGTPGDLIMAISGHKTEKAFLKYIKVTPTEKAELMRAVWTRQTLKAV